MSRLLKKFLIAFAGLVVVLGVVFCCIKLSTTKEVLAMAEVTFEDGKSLETVYKKGSVLTVPNAKISYNGNKYDAENDVVLYFPDESAYKGEQFNLSMTGDYNVVYKAKVDGNVVTASKTFKVDDNAYLVPSNSTVTYVEKLATQNPNKLGGGVSVELAAGAKFEYLNPINITSSTKDTPLITFSPYQYTKYMLDSQGNSANEVKEIIVRITDAYDPNNFVEVYLLDRWDGKDFLFRGMPYATAGSNGQTYLGLDPDLNRWKPENNNGKIVTYKDVSYCAVYKNFGLGLGVVPLGETLGEQGNGGYISIFYDYNENAIYAEAPTKEGNNAVVKKILINDFDDNGIYPTDAFKGFTTGEVNISIWADDYLSNSFRFEISEIYGKKGEDLKESNNPFTDTVSPVMTFENTIPQILYVQRNADVQVLQAKAFDVNLLGDVTYSVWYGYGSQNAEWISVSNGKFTPTKLGVYTVEYNAKDSFGHQTLYTINYTCVDEKVVSFDALKINGDVNAGSVLELDRGEGNSFNGELTVKTYAVCDRTKEIINVENDGKLKVEYTGKYSINYEYTDGFITQTLSYDINVIPSNVVIIADPILPEYVIKDAKYTFETVYASTYLKDQPELKETEVFVSEDGGEFKKINNSEYKVNATNSIKFKYQYAEYEKLSEDIKVVNVGFGGKSLAKKDYFQGENITTKSAQKGVVLTSNIDGDVEASFINVLPLSSFVFEFSLPSDSNLSKLEITLIDYYDRSIERSFTYKENGEKTSFSFDGYSTEINKKFNENVFAVSCFANGKIISERNGLTANFNSPFTSDKVLLKIKMYNCTAETSSVIISTLCNASLNSNPRDNAGASITFENNYGGLNEPNSLVTIYKIEAIDVLSPYLEKDGTVSIYMPSEVEGDIEYAESVDGVIMSNVVANKDYVLKLSKIGKYLVTYNYIDQKNNHTNSSYEIVSADMQPPTITLKDNYDDKTIQKVKVGETVKIKDYELSDNGDIANVKVLKYALYPDSSFYMIEDDQVVTTQKGDYIVYYYCYDEFNNIATAKYTIRAK